MSAHRGGLKKFYDDRGPIIKVIKKVLRERKNEPASAHEILLAVREKMSVGENVLRFVIWGLVDAGELKLSKDHKFYLRKYKDSPEKKKK